MKITIEGTHKENASIVVQIQRRPGVSIQGAQPKVDEERTASAIAQKISEDIHKALNGHFAKCPFTISYQR